MKGELLQQLITQLTKTIKDLQIYAENERNAALQAPSRMESRYDSEKQEASYRANELIERKYFIEQIIQTLTSFASTLPAVCEQVKMGALIKTQDEAGTIRNYFILPAGEGEVISRETPQDHIFILSPNSPLFPLLENKKLNDTYLFRDKQFTITDII